MTSFVKRAGLIALGIGLMVGSTATPARADITLNVPSIVFNSPGNWTWTYTGSLSADETINSTGAVPTAVTDGAGVPTTGFKDYFTLYDVFGYLPGTAFAPAGWSILDNLFLGATDTGLSVIDSPSVINITYYRTGANIPGPQDPSGNFGFHDVTNTSTVNGMYSASATQTSSNFVDDKRTSLTAPSIVPEPASLLLLGTGLLGVAVGARRRRGRQ